MVRDAAVAQWIRLCLPSCSPGFESQVHHLNFYKYKFKLCHVEKTKINRKSGRAWPMFLKNDMVLPAVPGKDANSVVASVTNG